MFYTTIFYSGDNAPIESQLTEAELRQLYCRFRHLLTHRLAALLLRLKHAFNNITLVQIR
jgi:hypothetical protein